MQERTWQEVPRAGGKSEEWGWTDHGVIGCVVVVQEVDSLEYVAAHKLKGTMYRLDWYFTVTLLLLHCYFTDHGVIGVVVVHEVDGALELVLLHVLQALVALKHRLVPP